MVGEMQWVVALGQIDIIAATATMFRFRPAPCQGHLKHLKCKCQIIPTTRLRRRIGGTFIICVKRRFQRICLSPEESLVREAKAAGFINFAHMNGKHNPADVCTKHTLTCE
eukprot:1702857-Ditylum_brightwellii.AAC.1